LALPLGILAAVVANFALPGGFSDAHEAEGVHFAEEIRVMGEVSLNHFNL